jgi:hypothetical protein
MGWDKNVGQEGDRHYWAAVFHHRMICGLPDIQIFAPIDRDL